MRFSNLALLFVIAPALAHAQFAGGPPGEDGQRRGGRSGGPGQQGVGRPNGGNGGGRGPPGGAAGAPPTTLATVNGPPPPAATGGAAGNNGNGNAAGQNNNPPAGQGNGNGANNGAANNGGNNGNQNGGNNGNNGGNNGGGGAINTALIPPYGVQQGVKANDGTQNCLGIDNKAIPCDCPPDINKLAGAIQDQVAGGAQFPTGNSAQDQLTRLNTAIVALQNVNGGPGSGVGCPAVSTNWIQLRTQLQAQA